MTATSSVPAFVMQYRQNRHTSWTRGAHHTSITNSLLFHLPLKHSITSHCKDALVSRMTTRIARSNERQIKCYVLDCVCDRAHVPPYHSALRMSPLNSHTIFDLRVFFKSLCHTVLSCPILPLSKQLILSALSFFCSSRPSLALSK